MNAFNLVTLLGLNVENVAQVVFQCFPFLSSSGPTSLFILLLNLGRENRRNVGLVYTLIFLLLRTTGLSVK
jgi:hypothetical protein